MTFEEFNFHPDLMKGIQDMRYVNPTPIQEKSIPPALEGKDVIANAQTGSGKTAAFLLPLIHRVMGKPAGKTRILILAPTRELACQIDDQALGFGYRTGVKCAAIYGGVKMERQEQILKMGTTMIIATPGRLLDHAKYGNLDFSDLDAFVLDEADRMLDMGFWPDVQSIIKMLPPKKQVLLFSATMPPPIIELSKQIIHDPVHVKIGMVKPPSSISQSFYPVAPFLKEKLLVHLLRQEHLVSTIVFTATKRGCAQLNKMLKSSGFKSAVIHGDLEQAERDRAILDFKGGKADILVATDVASRGIDITGVSHVINFDLPQDTDSYVHRIGRTARAKAVGDAYTFITPEDEERVAEFEEAVGKEIPRTVLKEFAPRIGHNASRGKSSFQRGRRPGGPGRGRPRSGGGARRQGGSGGSRNKPRRFR